MDMCCVTLGQLTGALVTAPAHHSERSPTNVEMKACPFVASKPSEGVVRLAQCAVERDAGSWQVRLMSLRHLWSIGWVRGVCEMKMPSHWQRGPARTLDAKREPEPLMLSSSLWPCLAFFAELLR